MQMPDLPNANLSRRANKKRTRIGSRSGVAAVETAVMLPLVVLFVFAPIEIVNGIFHRQSVTIAAYEGARTASLPGSTDSMVIARIEEVLQNRNLANPVITINPPLTTLTPRGTLIDVTVRAERTGNNTNPLRLFTSEAMEKTVYMVRN
jgi:Flp pilus assembly protein TadG